MSQLVLTLKSTPAQALNVSAIRPENLAHLSLTQIANTPLNPQAYAPKIGDLFHIAGTPCENIRLEGDCRLLNGIGFQMRQGHITLAGNAGDFLGQAMQGGTLVCAGHAGERVGDAMRRGLILIEGNAGDYCASRMLAGTVGVLGQVGKHLGFGMRRGTLLLAQAPHTMSATMLDCGTHDLAFLTLFFESIQTLSQGFYAHKTRRVQRLVGDAANAGKGEVLVIRA